MTKKPKLKPTRLAKKLKQIREEFGLSQNEMLTQLGFSDDLFRSNISQYELGTREPPLGVLLSYAKVAGVWVDVLIDDELELPVNIPVKSNQKRSRLR